MTKRYGRRIEGYVFAPTRASRGTFAGVVLVSDLDKPIVSFHETRADAERQVQSVIDRLSVRKTGVSKKS